MSEAKKYNPSEIEPKWQRHWQETEVYKTEADEPSLGHSDQPSLNPLGRTNLNPSDRPRKESFYILDMFPYPSGEGLHVGHPKGYIATDIYSRLKRMQGYNVLHPMGFDAFGLPAEQYAIKNKLNPNLATAQNVARYKEQLEILGLDYDWSREVNTTDPKFYKWTQWCFKQMYKAGLVSESYEPINWCPTDKTGLANEDVENGLCERCGTPVEKKPLRQWSIRITDYADRLLTDLDKLDWEPHIKELQKNWIGKSEGAEIVFEVQGVTENKLTVFTTRPDTLFGVTYLAVSHELAQKLIDSGVGMSEELKTFITELAEAEKNKTQDYKEVLEKKGMDTGLKAVHPITKEELPIWVANYVISGYGTGAVMAVPAHDERDFEFATKYNLPTKEVIRPYVVDHVNVPRSDKETVVRENVHAIVHDPKTNRFLILRNKEHAWDTVVIGGIEKGEDPIEAARREVTEETGYTNLKYIRTLGNPVQAGYFAKHKDQNRVAISTCVYFQLVGDERIELAEDEGNEILWIDEKDFAPGKMINSELSIWLERLRSEADIAYMGNGILTNSSEFNGLSSEEVSEKVIEAAGGRKKSQYKLRDWVFARQRYWGEPFPIVFDDNHTPYVVADSELPVILPPVENYEPTDTGESPLALIKDWVEIYGYINNDNEFVGCNKEDEKAKLFRRETNTMPQWAGSSWYYLRYIDPHNDSTFVDKNLEKEWSPVDFYVGGAEHATRHLIYARFWHKFLYDQGHVSHDEPFTKLQTVGLIMAEDGRKMSKRWGNVVNPDDVITQYGADTLRVYEMFMGPFDQSAMWSTDNIVGSRRFLERVWKLQEKINDAAQIDEVLFNSTIKKVTEDILGFKFNTAISQMMTLLNAVEKTGVRKKELKTILKLLAPFAPHMTEELWSLIGNTTSVHQETWPIYDETKLESDTVTISIQVNGKLRGTIEVIKNETKENIITLAKNEPTVAKWLGETPVKKEIHVPGKLVNFVV